MIDAYNEYDEYESYEELKNTFKFPCCKNGDLIRINDCMYCHKHSTCDIYATMLDEIADIKNMRGC